MCARRDRRAGAAVALLVGALGMSSTALAAEAPASSSTDLSYDEAFAEAHRRQSEGDLEGARAILEALAKRYPQDYPLSLELGWVSFRLADYKAALAHYERASTLSEGAFDAELGVAFSELDLGRHREACPRFDALSARDPDHLGVKEGLAWCALHHGHHAEARDGFREVLLRDPERETARMGLEAAEAWPWVRYVVDGAAFGRVGAWRDDTALGAQLFARARATAFDLVDGKLAVRGMLLRSETTTGQGQGSPSSTDDIAQVEAYASVGVRHAWANASVSGALVYDPSGFGLIPIAGASAHMTVFGDLALSPNVAFVEDKPLVRVPLQWRIPLLGPSYAIPGVAVQYDDGTWRPSARLTSGLAGPWGEVYLGGRIGAERVLVDLEHDVVYNLPQPMWGSVWVGGRIPLFNSGWALSPAWEMHLVDDADGYVQPIHYLGATLSLAGGIGG